MSLWWTKLDHWHTHKRGWLQLFPTETASQLKWSSWFSTCVSTCISIPSVLSDFSLAKLKLQACFNNLFWTLNWATDNPPRVFHASVTFLLTVICSLNTDSRKPDFSSEFILFSSTLCFARSCWFDVPALALLALSTTLLLLGCIDFEMDLRGFEMRMYVSGRPPVL